MPQTTDEKGEQDGGQHPSFLCSPPGKSHGEKDIVVHPRVETDVPTVPELRNTLGEEGSFEIAHQLDAEEFGRPDRDVRVP